MFIITVCDIEFLPDREQRLYPLWGPSEGTVRVYRANRTKHCAKKKKKVQFLKVATSGCKMLKLEIRPAKFKSSPPFLEHNVNRSVPLKQVKLHVLNETALPRLTSGDNSQWTANVSQSFRPLSSWRHSNALKHNCCRSLVTNTAKYFTEHGTVLSFSLKKMLMLEWSLLGCLYEGE